MPRQGVKGTAPSALGKRERVLHTFAGKEVDRRPFTFWYPFGLSHMKGESLAAAALTFAATYGMDLLRVPLVRDLPFRPQTSLDRPHDLTQLEVLNAHSGYWAERLEALKIMARMGQKKVAIFETVAEPWTALSHVCRKDLLSSTESGHANFLEKALEDVGKSLQNYLTELARSNAVDGVVVEIESVTYEQREPEVFESLIKPHLKTLLNHLRQVSEMPIWLQARGHRLYLEPLVDLPHNMLSWPHLSAGPKPENGLPKGYRGQLAGGLDESAIPDMSYQDIRRHVEEARNQYVALLCPGDQLPADLSPARLDALSNFLGKRDRAPGSEQT